MVLIFPLILIITVIIDRLIISDFSLDCKLSIRALFRHWFIGNPATKIPPLRAVARVRGAVRNRKAQRQMANLRLVMHHLEEELERLGVSQDLSQVDATTLEQRYEQAVRNFSAFVGTRGAKRKFEVAPLSTLTEHMRAFKRSRNE